jgi:hypothetical protein
MESEVDFSLGDLIRGLIEHAVSCGIKSLPPFNDHLWHTFLYKLKKCSGSCILIQEIIGPFDWDGPHPKYGGLNEIMFGLRYIYKSRSPRDPRIDLKSTLRNKPKNNDPRINEAISIAFNLAGRIPNFLER